jgi:hypothetical protein
MLESSQAVALSMPKALDAPQADIDRFVMNHLRRSHATRLGVFDAATTPQREVDRAVTAALTVTRQEKAAVLEEHILARLATRHAFGRADITEWVRKVALCGVQLGRKRGGPFRTKQTGVYPKDSAFVPFMKALKTGWRQLRTSVAATQHRRNAKRPSQRTTCNTSLITHFNLLQPPSAGAGERERLLTCLYYPIQKREQNEK